MTAAVGFGCYSEEICFTKSNESLLPNNPYIYKSGGYDGQFYFYIAAGYFQTKSIDLDSRPFRLSRIGFPLLSAPASFFGPEFLVFFMSFILLIFHLISVLSFYRLLNITVTAEDDPDRSSVIAGTLLYSVNPLSLASFLLTVSDGLALSLAVISVTLYIEASRRKVKYLYILSWFIISYSLLTKETMLAVPAGFLLLYFLQIIFIKNRKNKVYALKQSVFWFSVLIPLFIWWKIIDFSPFLAAERGGFPFSGVIEYLKNSDALFSGRSFLVLLLIIYLALIADFLINLFDKFFKRHSFVIYSEDPLTMENRNSLLIAMTGIIAADVFLISSATSHEYWSNFLNIARIYTSGILPLIFLATVAYKGKIRKWIMHSLGIIFLLFLVSIIKTI
jgi:hypothetical protein